MRDELGDGWCVMGDAWVCGWWQMSNLERCEDRGQGTSLEAKHGLVKDLK